MPKPTVPPELVQFYLPGLELALQSLCEKVNQVRYAAGLPTHLQIVTRGTTTGDDSPIQESTFAGSPPPLPSKHGGPRHITPEGRLRMREGQIERWKKARKKGGTAAKIASVADLIAFAQKHDGLLDKVEFHRTHPNTNMIALGNAVKYRKFVRQSPTVYRLNVKEE